MKTEWDYTNLAKAYLKRPDYSDDAINEMFEVAALQKGDSACDIGAGVAHLTLKLASKGLDVICIEPNDEMRKYGVERTKHLSQVKWHEGTGEKTGQKNNMFNIATFGSSFNVTDRLKAMKEVARIAKPHAWFAVMWNHRDLEDPIQATIEKIIKNKIPEYGYGTRREDQTEIIKQSGLFGDVIKISGNIIHTQLKEEVVEAWESHATLHRQAGELFPSIINDIEHMLKKLPQDIIKIPYTTRLWMAQLK